jgi:hypothetical protein
MRCPVCDDLDREYRTACHAEASETLRLRYEMLDRSERGSMNTSRPHWETVLSSKREQLKIAFRLVQHRSSAHSA